MSRKPSVLDRIIRSSKNPDYIIRTALEKLPPELLPRFVEVGFESFVLKNSIYTEVESRKLNEIYASTPLHALSDIPDLKMFYLALGILKKNKDKIAKFVLLEQKFNDRLALGHYEEAISTLQLIEDSVGKSFWTEKNKISLNNLINPNFEYILPEDLKPYHFLSSILKYHSGVANSVESEEDFITGYVELFKDLKRSDLNELLKYKMTGFHPSLSIDPFKVLACELNSTLIDFYKAFEFICLQSIYLSKYKRFEKISLDFFALIGYEQTGTLDIENIELSKHRNALDIVDCYTQSDYESVITKFVHLGEFDIGLLTIYAKSLSFVNVRCIPSGLFDKIANFLADIYQKSDNYLEAINKLSNLCCAFSENRFFFLVLNVIYVESNADIDANLEGIELCPIYLSSIPTPFKLSLSIKDKSVISTYQKQRPSGATFDLFKTLVNFDCEKEELFNGGLRETKYIGQKFLSCQKTEKALQAYESINFENDCSIKKDYLIALIQSNSIAKASEYFLKVLETHQDALSYFAVESLHEQLLSNVNKTSSIILPLALYKFREVQNTSLNKNATAISISKYLKFIDIDYPSNIEFADNDKSMISFLDQVCNRELLCKSMLFRFQKDAYDERIKICNLLSSRKLGNIEKLVFESKELSKRKVLDSAAKQVSSSKVYADKDFIRTTSWDVFSSHYDDYIDTVSIQNDVEEQLEEAVKKYNESKHLNLLNDTVFGVMSRHVTSYLKMGDNRKAKNLYSLIKCVVEEYCFGIKGLNSYLSTRIRHGTLSSTLLNPLINDGVVSDDEITEDNELINIVSHMDKPLIDKLVSAHRKFNLEITKTVDCLVNDLIQIQANGKGNEINVFNYNIEIVDVSEIQKLLGSSPSIKDCWEHIDVWINNKTMKGCSKIQNEIDTNISNAISDAINNFELLADRIISESDSYEPQEFLAKLTKAKQKIFNQLSVVKSWFDIDYSIIEQEYSFDIVTDIAETMLRSDYISNNDCLHLLIPHGILSPMVDIVYNLLSNAIKHSNVDRKELKINLSAIEKHDEIIISMKNNAQFTGDINSINQSLGVYTDELSPEDLKNLLQKEGGTGIAKIVSILQHDLNSSGGVELKYLNEFEFCASISIAKSCGVSISESINS